MAACIAPGKTDFPVGRNSHDMNTRRLAANSDAKRCWSVSRASRSISSTSHNELCHE